MHYHANWAFPVTPQSNQAESKTVSGEIFPAGMETLPQLLFNQVSGLIFRLQAIFIEFSPKTGEQNVGRVRTGSHPQVHNGYLGSLTNSGSPPARRGQIEIIRWLEWTFAFISELTI